MNPARRITTVAALCALTAPLAMLGGLDPLGYLAAFGAMICGLAALALFIAGRKREANRRQAEDHALSGPQAPDAPPIAPTASEPAAPISQAAMRLQEHARAVERAALGLPARWPYLRRCNPELRASDLAPTTILVVDGKDDDQPTLRCACGRVQVGEPFRACECGVEPPRPYVPPPRGTPGVFYCDPFKG